MKIISINIWRYFDWDKRKQVFLDLIKKEQPDLLFMQEVAYDERLKDKYSDQVDEVNSILSYSTQSYGKLFDMLKWHKDPIDWKMNVGLGVLSNYKLKSKETVLFDCLKYDRKMGFIHLCLDTPDGEIDILNVHFENNDEGSLIHLKKTMDWCRAKGIKPIIAGDFNMKIISDLRDAVSSEYQISYDVKEYYSFMPNKYSNNDEPITLDYVIVHKDKFNIKSIESLNTPASDHFPILAEVEFKK